MPPTFSPLTEPKTKQIFADFSGDSSMPVLVFMFGFKASYGRPKGAIPSKAGIVGLVVMAGKGHFQNTGQVFYIRITDNELKNLKSGLNKYSTATVESVGGGWSPHVAGDIGTRRDSR